MVYQPEPVSKCSILPKLKEGLYPSVFPDMEQASQSIIRISATTSQRYLTRRSGIPYVFATALI